MSSSAADVQEARARHLSISEEVLTVDLVDGRTIIVPLEWYPRQWHGMAEERNHFEIFGDGAYIHWPDLDEDLTVAGLLVGRHSGERAESFRLVPRALRQGLSDFETNHLNYCDAG